MKWGFTGSQKGAPEETILRALKALELTKSDTVITGACVGVDVQVSHLVAHYWPEVHQIIVVPDNKSKVDVTCYVNANHLHWMMDGTSYRARNEWIVDHSDKVIAFWTGAQRSGTYMTMNIARRANKLHTTVRI